MAKYTAIVEGTSGQERKEVTAKTRKAAEKQVRTWVQDGSYDEPGTVVVWLHGPDGTLPISVSVG